MSPELWAACLAKRIIVACIPAHSSQLMQPLDIFPNANVKHELPRVGRVPKRKKQMTTELPAFFLRLYAVFHRALDPLANALSFAAAGIVPFNPPLILSPLPLRSDLPSAASTTRRNYFALSGLHVTDPDTIQRMRSHIESRAASKRKGDGDAADEEHGSDDEEDDLEVEAKELEKEMPWLHKTSKQVIVFDELTESDGADTDDADTDEFDSDYVESPPWQKRKKARSTSIASEWRAHFRRRQQTNYDISCEDDDDDNMPTVPRKRTRLAMLSNS
jgi:hypothetical protein